MTRHRDSLRLQILAAVMVTVVCVSLTTTIAAFTVVQYHLRRFVLWEIPVSLVVAAGIGLILATVVTRALRRTADAAQRFGAGNLAARAPVSGPTELAELGHAFNTMADRLSDTLRDLHESQTLQHRFVSDVSHELRTPLAAVLAADEGLDSDDPTTRERSIELVREQTRRLVTLVDDLLEMSRFDAGQADLEIDRVDLVALAADAADTVGPDADVRITQLGDTEADVDARRIHTVLRNLVGNALQHGAPPVDIVVDGRPDDAVSVTVADDGPGVPAHLRTAIFDRFVRADDARTARDEHSGLGLAIAAENARLHRATITLSTSGRTAFTVHIPRAQPSTGHAGDGGPTPSQWRER